MHSTKDLNSANLSQRERSSLPIRNHLLECNVVDDLVAHQLIGGGRLDRADSKRGKPL